MSEQEALNNVLENLEQFVFSLRFIRQSCVNLFQYLETRKSYFSKADFEELGDSILSLATFCIILECPDASDCLDELGI